MRRSWSTTIEAAGGRAIAVEGGRLRPQGGRVACRDHGRGVRPARRAGQQRRHREAHAAARDRRGGLGAHDRGRPEGAVPLPAGRGAADAEATAARSSTSRRSTRTSRSRASTPYAAAKGGLRMLMRNASLELAPLRHPGEQRRARRDRDADQRGDPRRSGEGEAVQRIVPLQRWATPEEVARGRALPRVGPGVVRDGLDLLRRRRERALRGAALNGAARVAVLFDIDGTLIDDRRRGRGVVAAGVRRALRNPGRYRRVHRHRHDRPRGRTQDLRSGAAPQAGTQGVHPAARAAAATTCTRRSRNPKHYRVLPGVEELLPKLIDDGYLLGLVTGNLEAAAHIKLHRAQAQPLLLLRRLRIGLHRPRRTDQDRHQARRTRLRRAAERRPGDRGRRHAPRCRGSPRRRDSLRRRRQPQLQRRPTPGRRRRLRDRLAG